MKAKTTEHVAFSVPDVEEAVRYYTAVFGFQETDRQHDWVELATGTLKVYIAPDDGHSPCLNVLVADRDAAENEVVASGGSVYNRGERESLVQDKYGHCFCLSQES